MCCVPRASQLGVGCCCTLYVVGCAGRLFYRVFWCALWPVWRLQGWTKEAAYSFVKSKRKIAKLPQLGGIMPQWRVLAAFEETLSAKQD